MEEEESLKEATDSEAIEIEEEATDSEAIEIEEEATDSEATDSEEAPGVTLTTLKRVSTSDVACRKRAKREEEVKAEVHRLTEWESAISKEERELVDMASKLAERERVLVDGVSKLAEMVTDTLSKLVEGERELTGKASMLTERGMEFTDGVSKLAERERELTYKMSMLAERDRELDEWECSTLERRESTVLERERKLVDEASKQSIATLQSKVDYQAVQLKEWEDAYVNVMEEREEAYVKLIVERGIGRKEALLKEREVEVFCREAAVSGREDALAYLPCEINEALEEMAESSGTRREAMKTCLSLIGGIFNAFTSVDADTRR